MVPRIYVGSMTDANGRKLGLELGANSGKDNVNARSHSAIIGHSLGPNLLTEEFEGLAGILE